MGLVLPRPPSLGPSTTPRVTEPTEPAGRRGSGRPRLAGLGHHVHTGLGRRVHDVVVRVQERDQRWRSQQPVLAVQEPALGDTMRAQRFVRKVDECLIARLRRVPAATLARQWYSVAGERDLSVFATLE